MPTKFFLPILLFFYSQILQSQPLTLDWVVEDSCYAPNSLEYDRVITDPDGNVYLCTQGVPTASGLSSSILTRKYSTAGDLLWEAKLDNSYADRFYDCAFGIDGSFIVGGQRDTPPMIFGHRAEVASYHPETGEEQWKTFIFDTLFDSADLYDIDLDGEGNIYAFGNYNEVNVFDSLKAFVARIDHETGDVLWWKILPEFFSCFEGKLFESRIRVAGFKGGSSGILLMDIDLEGNLLSSTILPYQDYGPGIYEGNLFFEPEGHFISIGYSIYKWEIDSIPIWSFDFSRGLPNTRGQARSAMSDEAGNIYATGNLYDSLTAKYMTQTVKLSPDGELVWATVMDFSEPASWEAGSAIAMSKYHVFIDVHPQSGTSGNFSDNYQIALYSQADGAIVYDTLIDGNVRDIPYYAHYGNGHFYLLGRSYIDFSADPADYKYKLYSFTADEPVDATEAGDMGNAPTIYPNPTNGRLYVSQGTGKQQYDQLFLYDGQGRLVQQRRIIAKEQEFYFPGLPGGVYLLKLAGAGVEQTTKLVVAPTR